MKTNCTLRFVLYAAIISTFFVLITPLSAQDLLLFPKRAVIEEGKKSTIINLTNTGNKTVKYNISFVQIRMHEDGSFENITEPDTGQYFASPFIRYYPRTVTLGPFESQVVKLQAIKTENLIPGEYRSHLYFRSVPMLEPLGEQTAQIRDTNRDVTGSISVKLTPVYGITIPVIIRVGESSARVSISDMTFSRDKDLLPKLSLSLHRSGNASVYGDLNVNYVSPEAKNIDVGKMRGLAIYTPGTLRRITVSLQEPKGVDYTRGKFIVTYSTTPVGKGKQLVAAELVLSK